MNQKVYGGLNNWLQYNRDTTQQNREEPRDPRKESHVKNTDLIDWTEPHTFGGQVPNHWLP